MSDFVHSFWSHYIAWITLAGILACVVLLWLTSRKKLSGSADNTTGHVWDEDLREMNNPLPLWWVGMFLITIVFALFYLILYPGLGSSEGSLAWTSQNQYQQEVDQANADVAPLYARFDAMAPEQVALDPKARHIGEHLFLNNCAQCHGSDARGTKGFPNLTDADWLYGGSPEQIRTSITQGRQGNMPPMAAAVGSPEDVKNLAHHVQSLSGSPHDSLRAALGKGKFGACAACHGADGTGNQALGAPNLTDKIWLHGWGEEAIVAMVTQGKLNQMPGQEGRLTPSQIHVLSAYVWGLSQPATQKP
jgi:cytochrome c oxidase cbb3-type subunit 3